MLLDKLIPTKFLTHSSVCGLEIVLSEQETTYHYTILKKIKNETKIEVSGKAISINDLLSKINKYKIPLTICICGKGVIIKKVKLENTSSINFEELVSISFPSINSSDFFIQLIPQSDNTAFLCLVRKELIQEIMKPLNELQYSVVDLFISPAFVSHLVYSLRVNEVQINNQKILISNNVIEEIIPDFNNDRLDSEIFVENVKLSKQTFLSFGVGLLYFSHHSSYPSNDEFFFSLKARHIEKNKIKVFTYVSIALLFLISLVNFLVFNQCYTKSNRIDSELAIYQGKYDQISNLIQDYEKKKTLIEKAGLFNQNFISKYADKIAKGIPKEVILTDWDFNPIKKDIEDDSLMSFSKNEILIKGTCNKSLIINEWANVLRVQSFIKDVSLEKFTFNTDGNSPNFEIKILTQ
jgi:hypothetical protein